MKNKIKKTKILFGFNRSETIFKFLYNSGKIKLIEPENKYEEEQIIDFKNQLNNTNIDTNIINQLFLFDEFYIDERVLGTISKKRGIVDASEIKDATRALHTSISDIIGISPFTAGINYDNYTAAVDSKRLRNEVLYFRSLIFAYYNCGKYKGLPLIDYDEALFTEFLLLLTDEKLLEQGFIEPKINKKILKKYKRISLLAEVYGKKVIEDHLWLIRIMFLVVTGDILKSTKCDAVGSFKYYTYTGKNKNIKIIDDNINENFWIPLKVYIEEVDSFPLIRNIDELLEIKNTNKYQRFREVISEFQSRLFAGDLNSIEKLKIDIKKANNDLSRNRITEKFGGILTISAIPIAVAELFVGVPILSSFCTIVGTGLYINSKIHDWKNSWVALG